MPLEVTCSWRLQKFIRRRVQVTVEQLVHRDESSTEKGSLHRGKLECVESSGISQPHISSLDAASVQSKGEKGQIPVLRS